MTKEQNVIQKEEIYQQIQKLREEANKANVQIKNSIERRNQLNEDVKKAREEIAGLKAERDSINENVKLLKDQRDAIRAQSDPILEKIKAMKEKIAELKKSLPRVSQRDLQEEHDAIEWKISTTSLDLQEEKILIEDVKRLEILLSGYKKIDAQNNKIKVLLNQRKALDEQAGVLHKKLTDLAAKSQEIHSRMIEKVNTMNISKAQADSQHQLYVKTKEEVLPPIYEKMGQFIGQLNNLKASFAKEARDEVQIKIKAKKAVEQATKEKEQAIKEKLGAEARNKLQKGEKLSWNEFQLVMGDEANEDSEAQG
ncbi:MAG TPA: hypothetical protein VK536_00410 [Candidatus Limnocylindrales bacterium]|nr:hypothetical protein [Candidatus Limnocylindrales bacterium]